MPPRRRLTLDTLVVTAYVLGVFFAGTRPQGLEIPGDVPQSDKLLHALVFGGMAVLFWRVLRALLAERSRALQLVLAAAVASALGALLEVAQTFEPNRCADTWDWVADTVGATIACIGTAVLLGRLVVRTNRRPFEVKDSSA